MFGTIGSPFLSLLGQGAFELHDAEKEENELTSIVIDYPICFHRICSIPL